MFKTKKFVTFLFTFIFSISALAVNLPVGQDCQISWNPNPINEQVDSYKVAVADLPTVVPTDSGYIETVIGESSIKCSDIIGLDMTISGTKYVTVSAHNIIGWSDPSIAVPFSIIDTPSVPSGIKIIQLTITTTSQ